MSQISNQQVWGQMSYMWKYEAKGVFMCVW